MEADHHFDRRRPSWLIVNPTAGHGRGKRAAAELLAVMRARDLPFAYAETTQPREASAIAAEVRGAAIVVGGDGTVNEVVDGLEPAGAELGPLAVLPCGSGNDFAAAAGFAPRAEALVENLLAGHSRLVDVGLATFPESSLAPRRFVNFAGLGLVAGVASRARRNRRLRGRLRYVSCAFAEIARARSFDAQIEIEEEAGAAPRLERLELALLCLCSGPRFGGGLAIAPTARLDDRELQAIRVAAAPRLSLLLLLSKLLRARHLEDRRVRSSRCVSLAIATAPEIEAVLDGEPLPQRVSRVRFSLAPHSLRLIGASAGVHRTSVSAQIS